MLALEFAPSGKIRAKEVEMTISEVSERFGISQDTLRYYERIGLIDAVPKKSGRRDYGERELDRISFILCMRSAGLPIEVLLEYIDLSRQGDKTAEARRNILIEQRERVQEKIKEMQEACKKLDYKIDVYYTKMLSKEKEIMKATKDS